MAYTEKLSEQIAVVGGGQAIGTATAGGTSGATLSLTAPATAAPGFDMAGYHRLAAIAYGRADNQSTTTTSATISTTASFTAAIVISAGTSTGFSMGGTNATNLVSTTLTVSESVTGAFGTAGGTITATAEGCAGADIEASDMNYDDYPYVRATVALTPVAGVGPAGQAIAAAAVIAGEPRFRPANVTD